MVPQLLARRRSIHSSARRPDGARRLTEDDVAEEMRMLQIGTFQEFQWAILEANGQILFVKK
jgi:hypothetical protein